jgi:hypothetical protein
MTIRLLLRLLPAVVVQISLCNNIFPFFAASLCFVCRRYFVRRFHGIKERGQRMRREEEGFWLMPEKDR